MVGLGLAMNHPGPVGYYKPFKERLMCEGERIIDQDAYLMRKVLKLEQDEDELCPFFYDIMKPIGMGNIVNAYEKVRCDCELMLVEGTRDITTGYLHDLSGMAIAERLQAEVVLVSTSQPGDLERIAMLKQLMEGYDLKFLGVVLNMTDDTAPARLLEKKKVRVLGAIPPMEHLTRFTVKEVQEALAAEVIVGEDRLDRTVQRVMVGAMMPETALRVMRRFADKAIITGGDRSDIQMAALSTDTSCLVLTGGFYPDGQVVSRAYEKGVPILLTRHDTLEATEKVEHLIARIDPDDKKKLSMIKKAVRENVDLDALFH
jgi:BioD-like phosphotransacetylase family protein